MVGFVAIDQLLRAPDFRAGERALELVWAGAERVSADGQVVIQSSTPDHHALRALAKQELAEFYASEVRFREELGYPPFRRLCRLRVRGTTESAGRELVLSLISRLAGTGLSTYPPRPDARALTWTTVVKGGPELASLVRAALAQSPPAPGRRAARVVEVEMDPVD
jgi:primosomal protein N' (replication factor Y)